MTTYAEFGKALRNSTRSTTWKKGSSFVCAGQSRFPGLGLAFTTHLALINGYGWAGTFYVIHVLPPHVENPPRLVRHLGSLVLSTWLR